MGNGEAKELICKTHEYELTGVCVDVGGKGVQGRTSKGKKKWDNCNSIINKIYFKII